VCKSSEISSLLSKSENPDDLLLAELLDNYLTSLDSPDPISLVALQEQYPHLSDQLASFGEDVEAIHRATKKLSSGGSDALPTSFGIPKQIGDFSISREIGRGGMGIVYEAYQASLDRIKTRLGQQLSCTTHISCRCFPWVKKRGSITM